MTDGLIAMSKIEIDRLLVIEKVIEKQLTQQEGSELLKLSKRQMIRLVKAYRHEGSTDLTSKRRSRSSNYCFVDAVKASVKDLVHLHYAGYL